MNTILYRYPLENDVAVITQWIIGSYNVGQNVNVTLGHTDAHLGDISITIPQFVKGWFGQTELLQHVAERVLELLTPHYPAIQLTDILKEYGYVVLCYQFARPVQTV